MSNQRKKKTQRGTAPTKFQPRSLPSRAPGKLTTIAAVALLLVTVALVVHVRLRLADVPLERDEGEYAYAGQLILQGTPPYELAYNMKFPGTYYAYAALMAVFGQTAWGIRVGLLCVNLATVGLLFLIGRRLLGTLGGAVSASTFALLALDRWSMGVFGHATHFVTFAVAAGMLALLSAVRGGRAMFFVAAGFLMGLAVIMKQHAAGFVLMALGLAAWSAWRDETADRRQIWRRPALLVLGAGFALGTLVALMTVEGVLSRFWFWTIAYAAAYVSQVPLEAAFGTFRLALGYITQSNAWLWYTALAGLVLLFTGKWPPATRITLIGWFSAAALAIVPGFFFRPHYFIVLMPVAGLLAGVAFAAVDRLLVRRIGAAGAVLTATGLFVAVAGSYVVHDARYLFSMTHTELFRTLYGTNPFLEAPEIARYIKAQTRPDDRIVVLGSEPELFFYSDRKSATGYIYTYPLMENQPYAAQMQEEFRQEVETARPKYLVFVGIPLSWGTSPQSNTGVLKWANEFTARCYELAGIADINPSGDATIRWDADARSYRPRFPSQVWTFSRKAGGGCAPG